MDLKTKLLYFAVIGLVANGVLYFFGIWIPKLLFAAIACLIVGYLFPSDTSANM
jgi:hypothetical protein